MFDNHMLVVFLLPDGQFEMTERCWFPTGDEAKHVIFTEDIQYANPECCARAYANARAAIERRKRLAVLAFIDSVLADRSD